MRTIAILNQYVDSESLDSDDPAHKAKFALMTTREKKWAAYIKQRPGFDWFHYNFFVPISIMGPFIEYGLYLDFINMRGDVSKMRQFANLPAATRRLFESWCCWWVFYSLG